MSRTDKDKPWWVRAEWYEPFHSCGWRRFRVLRDSNRPYPWNPDKFFREWTGKYEWKYMGDCVLPKNPIREHPRRWGRKSSPPRCGWDAVWPYDYNSQTRGLRKKEYRLNEFHHPQRMKERLSAREAVMGNWEVEFPDGRTRHSVLWDMS